MKLLLLSDAAAPHTRRWANWFAAQGHTVHLATFNEKVDVGYKKVAIHKLWQGEIPDSLLGKFHRSILILWRLHKLIKRIEPDISHSHSLGSYAVASTFLNVRPRVVTPWGTDLLIDVNVSRINKFLVKYSLSTANAVTTDANHFSNLILSFGVKRDKLHFIPFGTDVERFKPSMLKEEKEFLTIISTRTLNPVHRVGDLIDAIPEIAHSFPKVKFIIVGGGLEYEAFRIRVRESGLSQCVLFTGMLSEDKLVEYLQMSDIYVSTSPLDAGLAASTAEAMSCGLPIIHPDVADNRSWADDSGGTLFKESDVKSLIAAIRNQIENPSKNRTMGTKNREVIISRNNLDTNMNRMSEIYAELISEK